MNYLSILFISFAIALSGALAPGPLLTMVISESAKHGAKTGPLVILGHALVELLMVALIAMGFARFLDDAVILRSIAFAGSALLIYLGVSLFFSVRKASLQAPAATARKGRLAVLGIVMSVTNPYWAVWWLTIGVGLVISAKKAGIAGLCVFFIGHILADLGWYSFVSYSLAKGRSALSLRFYKAILVSCSLLLVLFGIGFAGYALRGIG